jgi:hypothetical protein
VNDEFEWMMEREVMGQFEVGNYPDIPLEILRKITIYIGQIRRCRDRGTNLELPKYK